MPDLPSVEQAFEANVTQYMAALEEAINKAIEFQIAVDDAVGKVVELQIACEDAAGPLEQFASRMNDVRNAAAGMGGATEAAAGRLNDLRNSAAGAAGAEQAAASRLNDLRNAAIGAAGGQVALAGATGLAATAAGTQAATAQRTIGWFRLTANAIHWIVMGTLEIASTAIPAMVALGAAMVAMTPAFTFAKDQMTNLIIASGSLTKAIQNSPAPLHALAAGLSSVQAHATPDAFIIMGSAISVATMHTGVFAGVAQKASDVLANFATKIVTDLQGPAGVALAGFFSNAVKYMIQWGQFLGNLGHAFLNAVNAMWGVGQVLLDVLVAISHALLVISSNPIGAWFIGVAAAMSAVYRYGRLLVTIWNLLGGSALVSGIRAAIPALMAWVSALVSIRSAADAAALAQLTLEAALGPVGIAIAAIGVGLGIWYLATRNNADATDNLIKKVQSMPPTVQNLSSGIVTLTGALAAAGQHQKQLSGLMDSAKPGAARYGYALSQAAGDASKLTKAIGQQEQKLIELEISLAQLGSTTGQVGHDMLALSVQTDLQDSKVQQLNQAWDQYMSIVTGGTSGLAGMAESLLNIGKVTVTSTTALRGYNASVGLTTTQAAKQLQNFGQIGSQVWQNFNSTLTGSMQPLADWLRTAQTAGAISGPAFSKAILDMASGLTRFAVDSKPAQAELVAFAQESGLNIKNFPQLERAIRTNGASMKDLTGKVTGATIAMSNLNSIAKNLSTTLATQETQAIAAAALKTSGFTTDIQNMIKAQQTNSTVGGLTWQQWAAKAQAAQQTAQNSAEATARKLRQLQRQIDSMHGKNIQIGVNTAYTQSGARPPNQSLPGGYPGGVGGATGGFVHGPGTSTSDSIHARLSHGEYVMQAAAVEHYGRSVMDAMNAKRFASGGIAAGSPVPSVLTATVSGGGGAVTLQNHNSLALKVDGRTLGTVSRRDSLIYNRRNPSSNYSLRVR